MNTRSPLRTLRLLSCTALALAFLQIVFGAIVRITGSGMGCGDSWPTCRGYLFPPLERPDLVIEVTHRYLAAALGVAIIVLVGAAFFATRRVRAASGVYGAGTMDSRLRGNDEGRGGNDKRRSGNDKQRGGSDRGGETRGAGEAVGAVFRATLLAAGIYAAVALFGALTVTLGTHPIVNVVHLALAMSLLATLALAVMRGGGLGATRAAFGGGSAKTYRGALAAAIMTFVILVLGALTANLPGAAEACVGFPLCRNGYDGPVHLQLTHRIFAFLLFFHLLGLMIATTQRREPAAVVSMARIAFGLVLAQLLVAAALVELRLPPQLQSLHQAIGTLVWLGVIVFAAIAHRASRTTFGGATRTGPGTRATPGVAEPMVDSWLSTDAPITDERNDPGNPDASAPGSSVRPLDGEGAAGGRGT